MGPEQRGTRLIRIIHVTLPDSPLDQLIILIPSSGLHSIRAHPFPPVSCRNRIIGGITPGRIMGRICSIFIFDLNVSRITTSFVIGRITCIGYAELMFYTGLIMSIGSAAAHLLIHVFHREKERIKINGASILFSYKSTFLFPETCSRWPCLRV